MQKEMALGSKAWPETTKLTKRLIMPDFKPMLASPAKFDLLNFPVLASPKLDGIRAIVKNGVLLSRSLKPIPNHHVQEIFSSPELEGLDGELILGDPTAEDCYRNTVSHVMAHNKICLPTFHVFDLIHLDAGFADRLAVIEQKISDGEWPQIKIVRQKYIPDLCALLAFETDTLAQGHEGIMIRDPSGLYKHGRSTAKEGALLKVKRFSDSEAEIIGFEELLHNKNEKKTNELGRGQRSSHKAGKIPGNTLGALLCRDIKTNIEFNIGTGINDDDRAWFWANRKNLLGTIIKYKSFGIGVKTKPRHPVYLGVRHQSDLS